MKGGDKRMNKAELADVISNKIGISKKQAEETVELITDTITSTINKGGEVTFTGFGTFSARERKGRIGVNPRNPKEQITIPNVKVPKFKAGKNLKDTLKGKR